MSLPTIEPLPDENESLPPARRRRRQRMIIPPDSSERGEFLRDLSHRTVPSFDFFLFSLLAGLVLGVALLIDSPALIFLAALLSPFMGPMLGISLGTITGTLRFVLQSTASLSVGSLIVFLCGYLAGWAANIMPPGSYQMAGYHSQFTWPGFLVLALGAGLTALLVVRAPNQRPLVTSVAIAYGLYLPIGTAGFGLSSGIAGLWMGGLIVFLVHLVWAAFIGSLVLGLLGLRPLNAAGYLLGAAYALVGLLALFLLGGPLLSLPRLALPQPAISAANGETTPLPEKTAKAGQVGLQVQTPSPTPSPYHSQTPIPATTTITPTRSLVPSATATETITPDPTPVWAYIAVVGGDGALIREKPNYDSPIVQSLLNGTLVEVLPDVEESGGVAWVHIRTTAGKEGWIVRTLLRTATPAANW